MLRGGGGYMEKTTRYAEFSAIHLFILRGINLQGTFPIVISLALSNIRTPVALATKTHADYFRKISLSSTILSQI